MSNTTPSSSVASIAVVVQLTPADCGLACVAMLTGRPYKDVFQGAQASAKRARKHGTNEKELRRLAKGVGVKLRKRRDVNIEEDTGILWLGSENESVDDHACVLFNGTLIDPADGLLWDPDIFLKTYPFYRVEAIFELAS